MHIPYYLAILGALGGLSSAEPVNPTPFTEPRLPEDPFSALNAAVTSATATPKGLEDAIMRHLSQHGNPFGEDVDHLITALQSMDPDVMIKTNGMIVEAAPETVREYCQRSCDEDCIIFEAICYVACVPICTASNWDARGIAQ